MRVRLLAACSVTVALLSACGSTPPQHVSSCRSASAIPAIFPLVEVQPSGSTPRAITEVTAVACGTSLLVSHNGSTALNYGTAAGCQLMQAPGSSQPASLTSRSPADAFFQLGAGKILCTIARASPPQIRLCGLGTLLLTGSTVPAQGAATCSPDPPDQPAVFKVAVFRGSLLVRDPSGKGTVVQPGYQLTYNFTTRRPNVAAYIFSSADMAVFEQQASELGLAPVSRSSTSASSRAGPLSQVITFTSQAPEGVSAGEAYTVTASGGGSGNQVVFTVDPASTTGACSISDASANSARVTFTNPGTCVIDANQAGNAQYSSASQVQQTVTITALQ
jgi:hypothetical protein